MAEAESSTDKRMFRERGGVMFEEDNFLQVWTTSLQASNAFYHFITLGEYNMHVSQACELVWSVRSYDEEGEKNNKKHLPQAVEMVQSKIVFPSPLSLTHPAQKTQTHPALAFFHSSSVFCFYISIHLSCLWSNSSCTRLGADILLIVSVVVSPW